MKPSVFQSIRRRLAPRVLAAEAKRRMFVDGQVRRRKRNYESLGTLASAAVTAIVVSAVAWAVHEYRFKHDMIETFLRDDGAIEHIIYDANGRVGLIAHPRNDRDCRVCRKETPNPR